LFAGLALFASVSHAQFTTGFESGQGYSSSTILGLDDPQLAGTAAWYNPGGLSNGGSVQTYGGTSALRLSDTNTSGWSTGLNLAGAIDYTKAFKLSFDFAVASMSPGTATGTAAAINVRLGHDTNSNSNKTWARISFNADRTLSIWENSGGTTQKQTHIGNFDDFVSSGTYLTVSISVDPVTHTYTHLTLSGDLKTETITSVAGTVLPWIPNTAGEPPSILWAHTTGTTTSTSYIDNISLTNISNIPEPSTYAIGAGVGALGLAVWMRRRRQ
jgi:hypothetical protein